MQEPAAEVARKLADHPVLRVVKALTIVALAVIAVAVTIHFLRFTREVSRRADTSDVQPAVSAPQPPASSQP